MEELVRALSHVKKRIVQTSADEQLKRSWPVYASIFACVCTWGADFVLLLLEEASFSMSLNSLDNSSATASDAFRSSFMLWTEHKAHAHHGRLAKDIIPM